jgi:hypothetical protein
VQTQSKTAAQARGYKPANNSTLEGSVSSRSDLRTVREDWKGFANLVELPRKAGVTASLIPRLVVLELVANALDATGDCAYGELESKDGFYVENGGAGITSKGASSAPEEIAFLFSISRPLVSSKQFRVAERGALGNGLRVVAGAVLVSGGSLVIHDASRRIELVPQHDGTTSVGLVSRSNIRGTRVEVKLGGEFANVDDNIFEWASVAMLLTRAGGPEPSDRASVHHHDANSFADLFRDAEPGVTVRQLLEKFDGLSDKASDLARGFSGQAANTIPRDSAKSLWSDAKDRKAEPSHNTLGRVGELAGWKRPKQSTVDTTIPVGSIDLPCRIQVWARNADGPCSATICVNRCPAMTDVGVEKEKLKVCVSWNGMGGWSRLKATGKANVEFIVNIQCPMMPILTDGKAPDLSGIEAAILDLMSDAYRTVKRTAGGGGKGGPSKKGVILDRLESAVRQASSEGRYRYSLRQLFYAIRPFYLTAFSEEPNYTYFAEVIRDYELEVLKHDLPGIYRDNRGTFYHPHTGEEIPLGTRTVEAYKRPKWGFNKILYCEKEGFFPTLIAAKWPERHDCALLTSKGYASFAVRDLLDLLSSDGDEPIHIYCVHDADGYGTCIYESLVQGAALRSGRKITIHDLGLNPDEAIEKLKIQPEEIKANGRTIPVGSHIIKRWRNWLQTKRAELNAIGGGDSGAFIAWLDSKFEAFEGKTVDRKLVPPAAVVAAQLEADVADAVRERERERILREGGFEEVVLRETDRLQSLAQEHAAAISDRLPVELQLRQELPWWRVVSEAAAALVGA